MTTHYTIHTDGYTLHTENPEVAGAYSKRGCRVTAVSYNG